MSAQLASPLRLSIAAIPVIAFFATPFLPFVNTDALWLGMPSVLVWSAICVLLTVAAMNVVEISYRRSGGIEADAAAEKLEAAMAADVSEELR